MSQTVKTWTIELRGRQFILMSWGADISRGPEEVRSFGTEAEARKAADAEFGGPLPWRASQGEETKHDVVAAADRP